MLKTIIAIAASCVATVAALTSVAIYAYGRDQRQADINRAVCISVVRLDSAITQSLHRSYKALPKIQYYKQHPDELANQQAEIVHTLHQFIPPQECVGQMQPTRR